MIKDIVRKVLEEALAPNYQKHFDKAYEKWNDGYKQQFNTEEDFPIEDAEQLYMAYRNMLGNINDKSEVVTQFLNKHSGKYGNRALTLVDLQNFERLTFKEFIELLTDFNKIKKKIAPSDYDFDDELKKQKEKELQRIFEENEEQVTRRKIDESKKMWYDTKTAKINDGPLRVYEIFNQEQAIRMGYYYQFIHAQNLTKNEKNFAQYEAKYKNSYPYRNLRYRAHWFGDSLPWCVTMRGSNVYIYKIDEDGNIDDKKTPGYLHFNNQYFSYRNTHKYTFYFVIDDSKQKDDPYHISSLAVRLGNYILTSQYNDGDTPITWDNLVRIFPNISKHQDALVSREGDTEEAKITSYLDLLNEDENSENYIGAKNREVQMAYVQNGYMISKVHTWKQLNPSVRKQYIALLSLDNYNAKINNFELLDEILSRDADKNNLDGRMKHIGKTNGYKDIVEDIFGIYYEIRRVNILNKDISMYRNKETNKYGLYDIANVKWFKVDGIEYRDFYSLNQKNIKVIIDKSKKPYISECYTKGDVIDDTSLYSMFPIDKKNNPRAGAYFFTKKKYDEMLNDKEAAEGITNTTSKISSMGKIISKDVEKDVDTDIKEINY
jgi:hypothetical protein